MRIVNVIDIHSGVIDEIESFIIFDETEQDPVAKQEIVDKAEKLFIEKAIKIGMSSEDGESYLDDGNYDNMNGGEVLIVWSNVNY